MPTRDVIFPAGRRALYDKNRCSPAIDVDGQAFDVVVEDDRGKALQPPLTGIGVTWLYGFRFEIEGVAKLRR